MQSYIRRQTQNGLRVGQEFRFNRKVGLHTNLPKNLRESQESRESKSGPVDFFQVSLTQEYIQDMTSGVAVGPFRHELTQIGNFIACCNQFRFDLAFTDLRESCGRQEPIANTNPS